MNRGLLDTHAFLWLLQESVQLKKTSLEKIDQCSKENELYVAPISFWETAMLEKKGRIALTEPCLIWLNQALGAPGLNLAPLNAEISVDSANLPESFHGDPADRIIVSTARYLKAKLFTRDQKILQYAKAGHLEAVEI